MKQKITNNLGTIQNHDENINNIETGNIKKYNMNST